MMHVDSWLPETHLFTPETNFLDKQIIVIIFQILTSLQSRESFWNVLLKSKEYFSETPALDNR